MKPAALILALLITVGAPAGAAQPDAFIAGYAKQHDFNGSILISKQGKRAFAASYGLANIPFQVPNRAQTKYKIASITKLFTAVLILQLRNSFILDECRVELPSHEHLGAVAALDNRDIDSGGCHLFEEHLHRACDERRRHFASASAPAVPG